MQETTRAGQPAERDDMDEKNIEQVGAAATEETAEAEAGKGTEQETTDPRKAKKYSDEDLDAIIAKKIARERDRMKRLFEEEKTVSEMDERERNIALREMKADAKDALDERGLPRTLADVLDYTDKETMTASLEKIVEAFNISVQMGVKNVIRGVTPKVSAAPPDDDIRKAFLP